MREKPWCQHCIPLYGGGYRILYGTDTVPEEWDFCPVCGAARAGTPHTPPAAYQACVEALKEIVQWANDCEIPDEKGARWPAYRAKQALSQAQVPS